MPTSDDLYLKEATAQIEKWEADKPGYIARVGNFILWPAEKAAAMLIPSGVTDAVGKAVESCLAGVRGASSYTFDHEALQKDLAKRQAKFPGGDFVAKLKAADAQAKECWNWNIAYGAGQGGLTGAGGLGGLVINIPALFTVALREIQQIAACYGFNTGSEFEKEYVLQVLRTGTSGDVKAKLEFLIALKQVELILLKVSWKKMGADLAARNLSKLSVLAGMRAFSKSLGVQLTKRKALQAVPAIGAVVGASFDAAFVNDVGRAAFMCYRRRFIKLHGPDSSKPETPKADKE